ncbi:hypothetical protein PPYR_01806 [Photinus pyralis]|uniref:Peptidase M16 N-terminal domain-containing protein n=1 Tax=Photinus pyralis TaxID=7054 RepID=A0A5N4B5K3_PHOPY|nr:cytochrome b-c1 complex subunit 2, mitochondrial-like [Photinus pyralis]KAB0804836.1 hypothetical protein PPYR_01806 [Photinus pyralis]
MRIMTASPSLFTKICVRKFSSNWKQTKHIDPPVAGYPDYAVKVKSLPNKIIVAAVDNNCSLISRVSIVFRAGTRYETYNTRGVTQCLKVAAGCATKNYSRFAIMRNLQELCTPLTCSVGREVISYTLEGKSSSVDQALDYLVDVASNAVFKRWEVIENIPRLKIELESRTPQQFVVDLVHQAAYRSSGLGNSIYIPKHKLDHVEVEHLEQHVSNYFVGANCAIVGAGVNIKELISLGECINLEKNGCEEKCPAIMHGGEIRSDKGGCVAYVAIAGEGASWRNPKELFSFAILHRALGSGTYITHTSENKSPLAKILRSAPAYLNSITAFNYNYSDSGLFGVLLTANYSDIPCVIGSVYKTLRQGKISAEDFERGKQQAKVSFLLSAESGHSYVGDIATQVMSNGCAYSPCMITEALDCITIKDVNEAAEKLMNGKFSIASAGRLDNVPRLSDLCV